MKKHPITPKTKVAELLENYPSLEQELIDIAPEFSKLKKSYSKEYCGKSRIVGTSRTYCRNKRK